MPGTHVTLEESTPIRSSLASGGCWCSRGGTATGVGCELMCQSRRQSTVRPLHVEGVTGVKSPTHNLKMSSALALPAGPALVTSKRELFRARSRLRGRCFHLAHTAYFGPITGDPEIDLPAKLDTKATRELRLQPSAAAPIPKQVL